MPGDTLNKRRKRAFLEAFCEAPGSSIPLPEGRGSHYHTTQGPKIDPGGQIVRILGSKIVGPEPHLGLERGNMRGIRNIEKIMGYTHPIPQGDLEYQRKRNELIPVAEAWADKQHGGWVGEGIRLKYVRGPEWNKVFMAKMDELWAVEEKVRTMAAIFKYVDHINEVGEEEEKDGIQDSSRNSNDTGGECPEDP